MKILFLFLVAFALQFMNAIAGNVQVTINCIKSEKLSVKLLLQDYLDFEDKGVLRDSSLIVNNNCKLNDTFSTSALYYIDIDNVRVIESLYLEPGDSLHIEIARDSILYSGSRSLENQCFIDLNNVVYRDDDYYNRILSCNQEDLMKFMFNEMNKRIDFTKRYFSGEMINPKIMSYLMEQIEYSTARNIIYYLYNLKEKKSLKIDYDKLLSRLSMISLTKKVESLPNDIFKCYIFDYVNLLVKRDLADSMSIDDKFKNSKSIFSLMFEKAINTFDKDIVSYVGSYIIYRMIKEKSDSITLQKANIMLKTLSDKDCSKYLLPVIRLLDKKTSFLIDDLPDFELIDNNGNTVKLSGFKGKYVILDFWGTWCPPCLEEIKHMKTIQENNPQLCDSIVFIYLAMEHNNKQVWEKFISKKKLNGHHIYLENGWQNDLSKMYMINDAPHYILINKNGKIESPNFYFPSDKRFVEYLNNVLNIKK